MLKTVIRILINTAIGIVLIYFWLKLINIDEVLKALESFNPLLLIPATAVVVIASVLKAVRFKILLLKTVDVPVLRIINLTFLSQLLSFTIPIRLGELTKGVYLSTEYKLHFGKAVVWVFLDRFLDFWAVLGLSLLLFLIVPTNLPQSLSLTLFFGVGVASSLVIMVVLKPGYFRHFARILSHLLLFKLLKEKFLKLTFFMIDCFSLLSGSAKRNFAILVLTVTATFLEGLSWYIVLAAFIPDLSVLKVWLGSMLNALTFIIPAAPGYIGSAEAAGLAVFSFGLGLNEVFVSASTVIIHAISLVFILTVGIIGLYGLKFDLGLVWKKVIKK